MFLIRLMEIKNGRALFDKSVPIDYESYPPWESPYYITVTENNDYYKYEVTYQRLINEGSSDSVVSYGPVSVVYRGGTGCIKSFIILKDHCIWLNALNDLMELVPDKVLDRFRDDSERIKQIHEFWVNNKGDKQE